MMGDGTKGCILRGRKSGRFQRMPLEQFHAQSKECCLYFFPRDWGRTEQSSHCTPHQFAIALRKPREGWSRTADFKFYLDLDYLASALTQAPRDGSFHRV